MDPTHHILCFGNDGELQKTRALLLRTRYAVDTTSDITRANGDSYDLILLCHSLTSKQRHAVLLSGKKLPQMLALCTPTRPCDNWVGECFDMSEGPHALMHKVETMLA